MLAHAVAHCAGACFLDISPRRLDGKFPGKDIGMAMHIAFKVARSLAPAVVYIDEVEKVSSPNILLERSMWTGQQSWFSAGQHQHRAFRVHVSGSAIVSACWKESRIC